MPDLNANNDYDGKDLLHIADCQDARDGVVDLQTDVKERYNQIFSQKFALYYNFR